MPRDYKNIKKKKSGPLASRFNSVLSFSTGLAIGLFIAVIVYFHEHSANIVNNNSLLVNEPVSEKENIANNKNEDIAQLPEPQFDFYKILPNKKVNISEWEAIEEEYASSQKEEQPVLFVLQVGSFKEFKSADEIKAKLALMGITADIQRVVINGQDVRHRVRIGPYKNTNKLQQARDRILTNDLDFMLLKLKMEDI
ncbi:MAG: SPOR domain-containing protein [Proteobacteria bacterium]|nr:SPOR domain-containing protein [Pseudomonadota bacterium]